MRDPNRIPAMLELLRTIWLKAPDLRLGQLLLNVAQGEKAEDVVADMYNVEDPALAQRLKVMNLTPSVKMR